MNLSRVMFPAWRVASASLLAVSIQAAAILVLTPERYGVFALFYVVVGSGTALVYAVVCDPWGRLDGARAAWNEFSSVLALASILTVAPVLIIGSIVGHSALAVVFAIAICSTVYRSGARYYSVVTGRYRFVALADTLSVFGFWAALVPLLTCTESLDALAFSWMLSALLGLVCSEKVRSWPSRTAIVSWFREHWSKMKSYLLDTAMLETGSTGVPLALSPIMGLSEFGIYRSVSSAAVPVRMILNPLRPDIAGKTLDALRQWRTIAGVCGSGVMVGMGVYALLRLFRASDVMPSSALASLSLFAFPVALYVALNFAEMFFYLVLRAKLGGKRLILYRAIQVASMVVFPAGGFAIFGLAGAVWGYALLHAITLMVLLILVRTAHSV